MSWILIWNNSKLKKKLKEKQPALSNLPFKNGKGKRTSSTNYLIMGISSGLENTGCSLIGIEKSKTTNTIINLVEKIGEMLENHFKNSAKMDSMLMQVIGKF